MPSYVTPKKNTEYIFSISLVSQSDTKIMQSNPTIAAGDFKVSTDNGALGNLTTLPAVSPASSKMVKVTLSTSEMNGDNITFVASDVAGSEWCDLTINIQTTATQIDNLVRSTTPANTLNVDSNNRAEALLGAVTHTGAVIPTVTTLTGHTVQTGDSFGRIGAAGASLTDLGGMSTGMKAEVESEVSDALVAINLDHMAFTAAGIPAIPAGTWIDTIIDDTNELQVDWADSGRLDLLLDAVSTHSASDVDTTLTAAHGAGAWTTGAGGSDRLLMVDTTIATLTSQTVFTLTAGSVDDKAYENHTLIVEDVSTSTQKAQGVVKGYVGGTKEITLLFDPGVFTMAATDKVYILAEGSLKSTAQNRQLDVTVNGNAGIDWGNIENPTTAVDLSGTDIQLCDTITTYTGNTVQTGDNFSRIGAAGAGLSNINLPNQTMDITGNITGNLSGSVGSVTGAVGSVTGAVGSVAGNVDGNVTGSVGSLAGHTVQTGDNFARLGGPAGASVSADIVAMKTETAAIKAKTDNLPDGIKKNTALNNFEFVMIASSDHVTGKTGETVTAQRSIDGAAFAACANSVAEVSGGVYKINFAASDLNGDVITFLFTAANSDARWITIPTQT